MIKDSEEVFKPVFRDCKKAFEEAIDNGRLSGDSADKNFADNYMYMGTWENKDHFKNFITRKYDV